jgi:hypothetical protein
MLLDPLHEQRDRPLHGAGAFPRSVLRRTGVRERLTGPHLAQHQSWVRSAREEHGLKSAQIPGAAPDVSVPNWSCEFNSRCCSRPPTVASRLRVLSVASLRPVERPAEPQRERRTCGVVHARLNVAHRGALTLTSSWAATSARRSGRVPEISSGCHWLGCRLTPFGPLGD